MVSSGCSITNILTQSCKVWLCSLIIYHLSQFIKCQNTIELIIRPDPRMEITVYSKPKNIDIFTDIRPLYCTLLVSCSGRVIHITYITMILSLSRTGVIISSCKTSLLSRFTYYACY